MTVMTDQYNYLNQFTRPSEMLLLLFLPANAPELQLLQGQHRVRVEGETDDHPQGQGTYDHPQGQGQRRPGAGSADATGIFKTDTDWSTTPPSLDRPPGTPPPPMNHRLGQGGPGVGSVRGD
jgi:hypothetical protein